MLYTVHVCIVFFVSVCVCVCEVAYSCWAIFRSLRLAEAVNCPHDENNLAEVAECLRSKEAKTLVYNEWGSLGKPCFVNVFFFSSFFSIQFRIGASSLSVENRIVHELTIKSQFCGKCLSAKNRTIYIQQSESAHFVRSGAMNEFKNKSFFRKHGRLHPLAYRFFIVFSSFFIFIFSFLFSFNCVVICRHMWISIRSCGGRCVPRRNSTEELNSR